MKVEATREDILTKSGQYFDFLHPERYSIEITDIAHALANTCRFAGQCKQFYSVAQHSVYVSRIVPEEDAFAGLMHDCAEAFIGDVSRPLKRMLPDYRVIEKRIEAALFAGLGLPAKLPDSVKLADRQMLFSEQAKLLPPHDDEWAVLEGIGPAPGIIVTPLWPDEAYAAFMERYHELRPVLGENGGSRDSND
jgi:5'-deoxynucleotidase YfbR-like HD superfamily hydrolase